MEVTPISASNRCPSCAYPLDGLPGIAARAYEPCTQDVDCPECGLHIPAGSCCVVGASVASLAGGSGQGIAARAGARMVLYVAAIIAIPIVIMFAVLLTLQLVAPGNSPANAIYSALTSSTLWCSSVPGLFMGIAFPAVFFVRKYRLNAALDAEGARGGADVRLLLEPGVLRVFRGSPNALSMECSADDVQRIVGKNAWRFFPSPGAPSLMTLAINVSPRVRGAPPGGFVVGFFIAPAGAVPMDVARRLWWCVRSAPGAGAKVPVTVTAVTESEPPVCPRCLARLEVSAATTGLWQDPLPQPVSCARCQFRIPAGAVVLTGWITAPLRFGKFKVGAVLGYSLAITVLIVAMTSFTLLIPRAAMSGRFSSSWWLYAIWPLPGVLMALVLPRLARHVHMPRPERAFQPTGAAWIVQPGKLTIVSGSTRAPRGASRSTARKTIEIPARGITRFQFEFWDLDPNSQAPFVGDQLVVRGTATELGLAAQRHILLPMNATTDREQLVQRLNTTLAGSPPS